MNLQELAETVTCTHIVNLNTGQALKNKEKSIPMVDATDYFGGNYLKASDIKEPLSLTITSTKVQRLEDRDKLIVGLRKAGLK